MRKIYIAVAAFLLASIALFLLSFVYLDRSKHDIYYYTIALDSKIIGTIRVDRFTTEDKLIYKSVEETPFYPAFTESRSKLELSRKYLFESYSKERIAGRAVESLYMKNTDGLVSFLSRYRSRFSFVDNIAVRKDVFVFEDDSPMTYLPIIENYDFSMGRSQGFRAITCPPSPKEPPGIINALPPITRFVTLTSIRDEYLKVDSRKIKTENLVLKIRNYPAGAVWVAKSDKAIIKIELPAKGITITRSFRHRILSPRKLTLQDPRYISKEAAFKNGDVELSGTITVPTTEGPFPAVLLLGGDGPADRDANGLFISISDYLSKSGFCVLRFDRRGIGASKGDSSSVSDDDELKDASAALEYLKGLAFVDKNRMAVLGHSEGVGPAIRLASLSGDVKGLILMSPPDTGAWTEEAIAKRIEGTAGTSKWPEGYRSLVMRTFKTTVEKARSPEGDWITLLGRKCYVRNLRDSIEGRAAWQKESVAIPVYIMTGKEDDESAIRSSFEIDERLETAGNKDHSVKLFGYMGRFFGNSVNDGMHRLYHDTDKAVLEHIKSWLDKTLGKRDNGVLD